MTSAELERLADLHHLKREPPAREEIEGLIRSGAARLADALNEGISVEGRFDLAYNAAHALALAALRSKGYRAEKRYFVFQVLPHTLGTPASVWRLLAKCHEHRNRTEYEGWSVVDRALLEGLTSAALTLLEGVRALSVPRVGERAAHPWPSAEDAGTKPSRLALTDPDVAGALAALKRAAAAARRLSIETGTPFYVMENGRIVDLNSPRRKRAAKPAAKRASRAAVVRRRAKRPRAKAKGE